MPLTAQRISPGYLADVYHEELNRLRAGEAVQKLWAGQPGLWKDDSEHARTIANRLGWIGVLLLAGLIVIGYRNIIASYRRNPDTGRFRLAYFVTVIVSSFTEAAFRTESISWIAFLLITMASPTLRQSVRSPRVTAATSEEARFEPVAVGSGSPQPAPEAASSSNSIPQPPSPLLRRL